MTTRERFPLRDVSAYRAQRVNMQRKQRDLFGVQSDSKRLINRRTLRAAISRVFRNRFIVEE